MDNESTNENNDCFIIMPISDAVDYEQGHFKRVYDHIIKPTCEKINLKPIRADDVKSTNVIILDILKKIIESKIVICDLSSRNPNVLYELGIRQAFDLPVVLIKDSRTERIFDIQGIRTVDYSEGLRVDTVEKDIDSIAKAIKATLDSEDHDVNSLIKILSINKAEIGEKTELSQEGSLIVEALRDIRERISSVEHSVNYIKSGSQPFRIGGVTGTIGAVPIGAVPIGAVPIGGGTIGGVPIGGGVFVEPGSNVENTMIHTLPNGEIVKRGNPIYDSRDGSFLGKYLDAENDGIVLEKGDEVNMVSTDADSFKYLTTNKVKL